MKTKITISTLKKKYACFPGQAMFRSMFPTGVTPTKALVLAIAQSGTQRKLISLGHLLDGRSLFRSAMRRADQKREAALTLAENTFRETVNRHRTTLSAYAGVFIDGAQVWQEQRREAEAQYALTVTEAFWRAWLRYAKR